MNPVDAADADIYPMACPDLKGDMIRLESHYEDSQYGHSLKEVVVMTKYVTVGK